MGMSAIGSVTVIQLQDRGDPAAADFTNADLTEDGNWHDLDLSAIIADPDASSVLLVVEVTHDTPGEGILFRKNGNANELNIAGVMTQVDSVTQVVQCWVPCDAAQKIEYRSDALDATAITVAGWVS